jgi:hypothetical protein
MENNLVSFPREQSNARRRKNAIIVELEFIQRIGAKLTLT